MGDLSGIPSAKLSEFYFVLFYLQTGARGKF
jgi:hypothetical protein